MAKKLFTLLELMFVILIISLLFLVFSNFNTSREQEKILNARSCVNNVVWKLNNYINYAFTSKSIYTGWNIIYPQRYIIKILPKYLIILKYYDGIITGNYQVLDLNNPTFKNYWCEGVYFSGRNYNVILYKWFLSNIYHWWFEIYDWSSKVDKIYINFYMNLSWYKRRLIWQMEVNSIAKKIFYKDCIIWSGGDILNCKKRR